MSKQGIGERMIRVAISTALSGVLAAALTSTACSVSSPEEANTQTTKLALSSTNADVQEAARVRTFLEGRYTSKDVRHSFITALGQTIDCVEYSAAPEIKQLRAQGQDTTVAKPPYELPKHHGSVYENNGDPDQNGAPRSCPEGTIGEVRVTADEIIKRGGLASFIAAREPKRQRTPQTETPTADPSGAVPSQPPSAVGAAPAVFPQGGVCTTAFGLDYAGYSHVQETWNTPGLVSGTASLSIWAPALGTTDATHFDGSHDVAQIWMYSGIGSMSFGCTCAGPGVTPTASNPACAQTVEAGTINTGTATTAQVFMFATNSGYGPTGTCYAGGNPCGNGLAWHTNPSPPVPLYPYENLPTSILGGSAAQQHELQLSVVKQVSGGVTQWWIQGGVDASFVGWLGYFDGYSGDMATTGGSIFQAGGEVGDITPGSSSTTPPYYVPTWTVPMGSGQAATTGFTHAAYVHDAYPCTSSSCLIPPAGQTASMNYTNWPNYQYSSIPAAPSATNAPSQTAWSSWFYYGNAPRTFLGNYGSSWAPITWGGSNNKAECAVVSPNNTSYDVEPMIGVSESPSANHNAHSVLCGPHTMLRTTTPSSCHEVPFGAPSNNNNCWTNCFGANDWDSGYYKGTCGAGEVVSGVSENSSGQIASLLCCPAAGVAGTSCNDQYIYNTSPSPDWDSGYDKAQCPAGQYILGVSANSVASQGPVGAAHALRCCTP